MKLLAAAIIAALLAPMGTSYGRSAYRGYWMVTWFKQEFALHEMQQAGNLKIEPESLFDQLVQAVPPGSDGLVLQPYWSPGLKVPGSEARGAIIGFGDVHTRKHLYRAILEGLGYALREGAERTVKRSGVKITQLRVAGGGSQSDAAHADHRRPIWFARSRPHVYEASGLGAAIDAAVGIGLHPDFETAIASMTSIRDTFNPDPHTHSIYNDLYERVYLRLYRQLKPLYEEIYAIK